MEGQELKKWQINMLKKVNREVKPREKGLTMIIDKGLGIKALQDLLLVGGDYIDYIKFSFGTSAIYPYNILREKIRMIRENAIDLYPGGTLFEVAYSESNLINYLNWVKNMGFTAVEISDGTIQLNQDLRRRAIMKSHCLGLKVLTEIGKKDNNKTLTAEEIIIQFKNDISNGAARVIIEGRESGKGGSLYDNSGEIDDDLFAKLLNALKGNKDRLIWEAPLKKQQVRLINRLGSDVSLGNINPGEVVALEALRIGLRGDTFYQIR